LGSLSSAGRGALRPATALAFYAGLWAASTLYLAVHGADWAFPIISLLLFGGLLSGLAFWLTRGTEAPIVPVRRVQAETIVVLVYLLFYALVVLGWGLGAVKALYPVGPARQIAELIFKLIVHVGLPIGLLLALRSPIRPLFETGLGRRGVLATLIVLGVALVGLVALASPSLSEIAKTGAAPAVVAAGIGGSFVWMAIEAGVCEEFLFRAVLQSRLSALFGSPVAGIVVASLLFALAHAPGLYLRGGPGVDGWSTDPVQVAAFTIATLSPIAVLFGTLWARTRSFLLIVLLHACVDVLPHSAEFIAIWF
jgi:membrane protease YdiL (CAAX protease family)